MPRLGIAAVAGEAQPGTTIAITVSTGVDLVRVPSYRAFKGSYNGNDWGKVLASIEAAIKAGFKRAKCLVVSSPSSRIG